MNRATPPDDTRFRLLVESIGDVLWFRELQPDRFSYVSPAFERIWGHPVDELLQKPRLWEDGIHPEDRPTVRKALRQWLSGEKAAYDSCYPKKENGRGYPAPVGQGLG
jgi:PAS domain S-box-containing protein